MLHETFQLDAESVAALRAAVGASSIKRKKLDERLERSRENAARRVELKQRIERLHARITALRQIARPAAPLPLLEGAAAPPQSHLSAPSSTPPRSVVSCRTSCGTAALSPRSNSSTSDEFDETTIQPDSFPVPAAWGQGSSCFRYGGPSVKGAAASVIDGILYHIVTEKGDWAFYSDTRYYTVHVRYRIAAGSTVTPGHCVTVAEKGPDQELSMELGPEETKVLLRGRVVGFENLCSTTLLPRRVATTQEDEVLCAEPQHHWNILATSYSDAAAPDSRTMPTAHLIAHCVAKQIRFVDPHFFPSHASLYRDNQDSFYVPPLHWRLPLSYLPVESSVHREVRLFRGPALDPNGLRTGRLFPNHHLLSVAVGLACRWPQALRRLFIHPHGARQGKRERSVGAYHVGLCTGGWWKPWVVDEFIPASARCPEFSHTADDLRVLWMPLLEKACAKSVGSYAAMLDAPLEYFVGALTGGPCTMLREIWPAREDMRGSTAKAKRFFALMKSLLRHRATGMPSVVCWLRPYSLSTARTEEKAHRLEVLYGELGLDPNVATVVHGLETLGDGHCIVRLRQTDGKKRPTEAWLDQWRRAGKSWVDEVSDLVFAMEEAAGEALWMALEDLPEYFQGGCVAPLTIGWGEVRVQGRFRQRQPSVVLRVTVTAPTRLLASVTQREMDVTDAVMPKPQRRRSSIDLSQALAGLSCLLYAKGSGDSTNFLGSSGGSPDAFHLVPEPHFLYEREVSAGYLLDPCKSPYYVAPFVHATSSDVAFTITTQLAPAEPRRCASPHATPEKCTATVHFMTARRGAALFPNLAEPILRESSLVVCAASTHYQSYSPGQLRIHDGAGVAATLRLSGNDVP
ncbi:hypothetical protein LSCM1_01344 [Leishmania martiniquensis]|uniref:Calpain catalytic domain-containing protein n=1 Tax=Leishmania martiniquensis TaxID=1580590 RepID=A0A836GAG7_9TRYP|nr:hypothetical protein LSCM1_01344 [Leishmania martiniquensis]